METGKELAERAARALAASSKTSPTAAGPSEALAREDARIDAINQVFALFRLNYHNQYYKAYDNATQLSQVKKLWLESLSGFGIETLLLGARRCIEGSEYLPTLHRMLESCREAQYAAHGLPEASVAYREACLAPEPKHAQKWSHPAVYHAAAATGWFALASEKEASIYPAFERNYRAVCERLLTGEALALPAPPATTAATRPLDFDAQREALHKLREQTGL